ncbi:MAG: CocE/NonD family hydrolase, partial [Mycobacterium sp.]
MTALPYVDTSTPARSTIRQYTGNAVSRLLRLPPRTTQFEVHRGLRVPMRDGVDLIADHYVPAIDDAKGTLLVRCPYGRGWPISGLLGAVYASRGYHVLVQSVRGTFGSGGDFTPMINEAADGADT